MKRKIKRTWRHFKYWLVRKMFPDSELNFMVVPSHADIKLVEVMATDSVSGADYSTLDNDARKELLLNQMQSVLMKHMKYSDEWNGEQWIVKGALYIAKEQ